MVLIEIFLGRKNSIGKFYKTDSAPKASQPQTERGKQRRRWWNSNIQLYYITHKLTLSTQFGAAKKGDVTAKVGRRKEVVPIQQGKIAIFSVFLPLQNKSLLAQL